jgi:hypothetical protein
MSPGAVQSPANSSASAPSYPAIAASKRLELDELTFKDLTAITAAWILADGGA